MGIKSIFGSVLPFPASGGLFLQLLHGAGCCCIKPEQCLSLAEDCAGDRQVWLELLGGVFWAPLRSSQRHDEFGPREASSAAAGESSGLRVVESEGRACNGHTLAEDELVKAAGSRYGLSKGK